MKKGKRKTWRHLLFIALRAHGRQINGGDFGGEESQENGRGWTIGSICEDFVNAEWETAQEEEDDNQEEYA